MRQVPTISSNWLIFDMGKARGLAAILATMPPIDWAAIAADSRRPGAKGYRHDRKTLERMKKTRAANKRKAERAAARRREENLKARSKARRGKHYPAVTLAQRIAAAMEPGQWYARPDVVEITGRPYGSVKWKLPAMRDAGLIEQARNPAAPAPGAEGYNPARGGVYRKGLGIQWQAKQEPEFLFRLTAKGEELRRVALALV